VRTRVRRTAAALSCTLIVGLCAGCTGDSSEPAAPSPSSPSTGSPATLEPRPAPLDVRVTRVLGTLRKHQRSVLERRVGKVVAGYFDDAFLAGSYPRSGFDDAFSTFTRGARSQARQDRSLLTNSRLGPTTEAVLPKRRAAWLSVLAPYKVAAGVTARFDLRFVAQRGDKPARKVRLSGRLLLTRVKSGGWRIFGYHVARSVKGVS
jgi:hypothetical protein